MSTLFLPLLLNSLRMGDLNNSLGNILDSVETLLKYPALRETLLKYPALGETLLKYPALGETLLKYPALGETLLKYPALGDWILNYSMPKFDTPRLAIDADDTKDERKWLIRPEYGYSGWEILDNIFSLTNFLYVLGGITPTRNYVSKVGNTSFSTGTVVKFFIPETIPTGYSEWFADHITVVINGTLILSTSSYHNSRKDVVYDFSNIIKVNLFNYIAVKWYGSGNHGFDFGLIG